MRQLIRYGIVGVLSNAIGYSLYLAITSLGVGPKYTMTGLYFVGATIGFLGNRKWAFSYKGKLAANVVRYSVTHVLAYTINLLLLILLVDKMGFPHQKVQAFAIVIVAGFLFVMFRLFVFSQSAL